MSEENLYLWNKYSEIDPHALKWVEYGRERKRKFTAIDAYSLLELATAEWGPMGKDWGLKNATFQIIPIEGESNPQLLLRATFYYPEGEIPVAADEVLAPRSDASKKLVTACLKKGLSYLGFGASVHKGQFEDERTIELARQKWDREQSHENTVARLNNALDKAIGCKYDEQRDIVCQWLLEPGMTYQRVTETEGAPGACLDRIRELLKGGMTYPEMLPQATAAIEGEDA